jgi:predicted anti-sigma-YlaC factor YlaD
MGGQASLIPLRDELHEIADRALAEHLTECGRHRAWHRFSDGRPMNNAREARPQSPPKAESRPSLPAAIRGAARITPRSVARNHRLRISHTFTACVSVM